MKIKALQTDNSGEYVSQQFKDLCASKGIKWELMTPHNPQQNGVAKRKNRAIVGAARAMLHDQGLSLHLWVEACNTIVYLQNRSPHLMLGMKTPIEAFSGKQPDVSHFHIFGSLVFCHVTKDAQKKLDPTTELGILVGYTDTPHNYRVFMSARQRTELLVPKKEEPPNDVDHPHAEIRVVEITTIGESSRDGWKHSREADRMMQDARENVGQPSSHRRQRRSPDRYTGYMALVGECVATDASSFEEAVQQPVWVDAMAEEYDSIMQNSVWDVVPRPRDKLVVTS
eukprot:PITA_30132